MTDTQVLLRRPFGKRGALITGLNFRKIILLVTLWRLKQVVWKPEDQKVEYQII